MMLVIGTELQKQIFLILFKILTHLDSFFQELSFQLYDRVHLRHMSTLPLCFSSPQYNICPAAYVPWVRQYDERQKGQQYLVLQSRQSNFSLQGGYQQRLSNHRVYSPKSNNWKFSNPKVQSLFLFFPTSKSLDFPSIHELADSIYLTLPQQFSSINNKSIYQHYTLTYYQQDKRMNQKTLQGIYKTYQTQEFYRRYLSDLGCREDRRKMDENRPIKVTSKNNSIVLSCGQTIVIVHLQITMEQVTFSPISLSFGEPLLQLKASLTSNPLSYRQSKPQKALENYIYSKINWRIVQDQLVGSDFQTGKQYAYKGKLFIRVLGDDGAVEECSILAVQFLLQTYKFRKFKVNKEKIDILEEFYRLLNPSFLIPLKYVSILKYTLTDPSLTEEQNADYVVTVLKDLKNFEKAPTVIQRIRKNQSNITDDILLGVMRQSQERTNKIHKTFQVQLQQLRNSNECLFY